MGKKLIITEKPSVARDFARVLSVNGNNNGYIENNEYVISWCYGHLVQMSYPEVYDEKYKKWRLEDLPFLPTEYKYEVVESAKDQYKVVHSLLFREDIDTVYWAGDSGKEGQTIEENIRIYGGVREGMTELRVWIDSQTDDEIRRGIREAKPMSDYDRLGKSGIMRTIEDYSLGINFSRALSVKYGSLINDAAATKSYTAIALGRVMTCVLGMVVNIEREIRNFVETPFFRIVGDFSDYKFLGEWKAVGDSKYVDSPLLYKENGFKKEEDANKLIASLQGKQGIVDSLEATVTKKRAPLLFNLAELQSECSKIFKISPSQTLDIIQELYEKKLTTYPRTDARVLTTAVAKEIYKNIKGLASYQVVSDYVKEILDNKKYVGIEKTAYTDDKKVTDHYAIIPTGQTNALGSLPDLHKRVYDLIVRRFLAIFYPPAEYKNIKVTVKVDSEPFFASAKVLVKQGYLEVAFKKNNSTEETEKAEDNKDDEILSGDELFKFAENYKKGDSVLVNGYEIKEGKTSPPKRYTSGSLILAMENAGNLIEDEELREQIKKSGIGTSATRGEILEKLVRIKYLNQNSKTQIITPENLGEMIYEVVKLSVPTLLNPEMTANWEMGLEGIINGSVDDKEYRSKLEDYIRRETGKMISTDLRSQIAANINCFTGKDSRGLATIKPLGILCPQCGGELTKTSFGYGCSNYRNDDIKCGFSLGNVAGVDIDEETFRRLVQEGKTDVLSGFVSKSKKPFKAALKLTKDDNGKYNIAFDFNDVEPDFVPNVTCPDCGGRMIIRSGFYSCENNIKDDPESCKFFIGRIAQKELNPKQIEELLTNKATQTIRGFKGKSGKSFDAVLVLNKNEEGKSVVSFDFENVEAKILKDVKCPACGNTIEKTVFGYGCSGYNREDPEKGCRFMIGKIAGVKLTDTVVKELLITGVSPEISGFKSKSGSKFSAKLTVEKNEDGSFSRIGFLFDDEEAVFEGHNCPKCGAGLIKNKYGFRCEKYSREEGGCSFYLRSVAGRMISDDEFIKLLKDKETNILTGFTSKAGKTFDAKLKFDENFNVVFDFN